MHIVVLDGYTLNPGDNPWLPIEALNGVSSFTVYERTAPEKVLQRAANTEILLTNKVSITADLLEQLPALRFIGVLATGYDVVDIHAASAKGIPVANIPGYGTNAVAEHVFALLMELNRSISLHDTAIRSGEWTNNPDWCFWKSTQRGLGGKTLGIVGFGNTGRQVAEIGHALGMNILAYAPRPKTAPNLKRFAFAPLDELFEKSNVVTLHCPLNEESMHMVNAKRLSTMPDGAILLNTARGLLLDENAVAQALCSGKLGGFGADVVSKEPIEASNPLLHTPNTLITPHIAWATLEARKTLMSMCAENIQAFIKQQPINIVNTHLM